MTSPSSKSRGTLFARADPSKALYSSSLSYSRFMPRSGLVSAFSCATILAWRSYIISVTLDFPRLTLCVLLCAAVAAHEPHQSSIPRLASLRAGLVSGFYRLCGDLGEPLVKSESLALDADVSRVRTPSPVFEIEHHIWLI